MSRNTEVQHDYRHTNGELFPCVKPTSIDCRQAKENWINKINKTTQLHK
ncbi:MAG TPA: DUF3873 family protein [Clostridia bacterium]|nr:DUF3873 family protein [Clostridia bacterium]